jgi:hypothetical protein
MIIRDCQRRALGAFPLPLAGRVREGAYIGFVQAFPLSTSPPQAGERADRACFVAVNPT